MQANSISLSISKGRFDTRPTSAECESDKKRQNLERYTVLGATLLLHSRMCGAAKQVEEILRESALLQQNFGE